MEAAQVALLAYYGLGFLITLITGGVEAAKAKLADPVAVVEPAPVCFFQESVHPGPAVCLRDFTAFTLPEPDAHWAVRP